MADWPDSRFDVSMLVVQPFLRSGCTENLGY